LTDSVHQASFPPALADDAGKRFTEFVYRRMFGWMLLLFWLIDVIAWTAQIVASLGPATGHPRI
jgi:hypothetical protein